jgi:succinate dehydrogenase / fumarate reductase cytochrome b subunit
MSATAIGFRDRRLARFWTATNGKKAVMAVSGIILTGFVVGHMFGNLQVFIGQQTYDAYAYFLKHTPALLWGTRITLLIMVMLHIWASVELAKLNKIDARPVGYVRRKPTSSSYASRTMYWSGPIILVFVIYHLMQFTWGTGGTPFNEATPFANLVAGFEVPAISIFYIFAMALLMLHLYHGVWSLFQTLGVNHPRYTPVLRKFAKALALLLFLGFSSIPVAVLAGFVHQP